MTAPSSNVTQAVPFFWVRDIEASIRFYKEGLGFVLTYDGSLTDYKPVPDEQVFAGVGYGQLTDPKRPYLRQWQVANGFFREAYTVGGRNDIFVRNHLLAIETTDAVNRYKNIDRDVFVVLIKNLAGHKALFVKGSPTTVGAVGPEPPCHGAQLTDQ